jgi:adenylate cyclase
MIDLNDLRRKSGRDDFHIGIGLSTGAAIAGSVGSADRLNYTVLGTTVNVGARLCGEAAPGEILLAQATYLRLKNMVESEALPPLEVKGISFPLNVFRLSGLKAGHHA